MAETSSDQHNDAADESVEIQVEEEEHAVGRGLLTDGVIIAAVPSIILFMTYSYRLGRSVALGTPTAAITVDASTVLNTFVDAILVFWWQILVALVAGLLLPALAFPKMGMAARALVCIVLLAILVPPTSGSGRILVDPFILVLALLVVASLLLPSLLSARAPSESKSERSRLTTTIGQAAAIGITASAAMYVLGVTFAANETDFQVVQSVKGQPVELADGETLLVTDDYSAILTIVIDRASREPTGETRRYEDYEEMATRLEHVGRLDLGDVPNLGDLVRMSG